MRKVSSNMERIQAACSGLVLSSDIALATLFNPERASTSKEDELGECNTSGNDPQKKPRRSVTPSIREQVRLALKDCEAVGPAVDVTGRSATDTLTDILTHLQHMKLIGGNLLDGTSALTPPVQPGNGRSLSSTPQLNSLMLPPTASVFEREDPLSDPQSISSIGRSAGRPLGIALVAGDVSAGLTTRYEPTGNSWANQQSPARAGQNRDGGITTAQGFFDSTVDPNESIWPDVSAAQLALHEILLSTRSEFEPPRRRASSSLGPNAVGHGYMVDPATFQSIRASVRKAMMALYDATQGYAALLRQRDQLTALHQDATTQPGIRRPLGDGGRAAAGAITPSTAPPPPEYLLCVAFDRPKRLRANLLGSVFDSMRDVFKRFLKSILARSQTARFVSEDVEGCAYILSFSSALECICFDYCIQRYSMYLPWPSTVLELSYATAIPSTAEYASKASVCAGKEIDWIADAGRRIDQRGAHVKARPQQQSPSTPSMAPPKADLNVSQGSIGSTTATAAAGSFVGSTTGGTFTSFDVKEIRIARTKLAAIEQMVCVQVEMLNGDAEERSQQAALRLLKAGQEGGDEGEDDAFAVGTPRERSVSEHSSPSFTSSVQDAAHSWSAEDPTELSFVRRPPILPPDATAAQIASAFQLHYSTFSQRGPLIRSALHFASVDNSSRTAAFNVPQATVSGLCGLSVDGTVLSASLMERLDVKTALEAVGGFMWEHSFVDMESCERDRIDEYGSSAARNTNETRLLCLLDLQEYCGVYRGFTVHYSRGRQYPTLVARQARHRKSVSAASNKVPAAGSAPPLYPPRMDSQFYDDTIDEALVPSQPRRRKSSSGFCAFPGDEAVPTSRDGIVSSYNPWWWCSELPSINALTGDLSRLIANPTRSQACQTNPVQVTPLDDEGNPLWMSHRKSRVRSQSMARSISPRDSRKSVLNNSTASLSPSSLSPTPTNAKGTKGYGKEKIATSTLEPDVAPAPTESQLQELAEKLIASRRPVTAESGAQTQFGSYDEFPQRRLARQSVKELLYRPAKTALDWQVMAKETPVVYGYDGFTDAMWTAASELREWILGETDPAVDDAIARYVNIAILKAKPTAPSGEGGGGPIGLEDQPSNRVSLTSTLQTPLYQPLEGNGFAAEIQKTMPSLPPVGMGALPPRHINAEVSAYRNAVIHSGPRVIGMFESQAGSEARAAKAGPPRRQQLLAGPDPATLFRPAGGAWGEVESVYTQLLASHRTPGAEPDDTANVRAPLVAQGGCHRLEFMSEDAAVSRAVVASIFHAVAILKEDYTRKLEYQRVVTLAALEEARQRIQTLEEQVARGNVATVVGRNSLQATGTSPISSMDQTLRREGFSGTESPASQGSQTPIAARASPATPGHHTSRMASLGARTPRPPRK